MSLMGAVRNLLGIKGADGTTIASPDNPVPAQLSGSIGYEPVHVRYRETFDSDSFSVMDVYDSDGDDIIVDSLVWSVGGSEPAQDVRFRLIYNGEEINLLNIAGGTTGFIYNTPANITNPAFANTLWTILTHDETDHKYAYALRLAPWKFAGGLRVSFYTGTPAQDVEATVQIIGRKVR